MSDDGRDGFVIREFDSDAEVHFVACTKDGRMREKVEEGLVMRADTDRYYVTDLRDERNTE